VTESTGCPTSIDIVAFETAQVDPEAFDHEAHVQVGWQYLSDYALDEALARFSAALQRLTRKLGVSGKYHETITWFFMILISERMAQYPDADWPSFRAANDDLISNAGQLLAAHYTPQRLQSPLARRQFLMPDRSVVERVA